MVSIPCAHVVKAVTKVKIERVKQKCFSAGSCFILANVVFVIPVYYFLKYIFISLYGFTGSLWILIP